MTCQEQLDMWVSGKSIHNKDRDECCPDFSCCQPELLASQEIREKFRDSDDDVRMEFLGMFLGAAIQKATTKNVYVAGLDVGNTQ